MPRVVISYRRADSAAISGRLYDRLATRFGRKSVFIDIDHIPLSSDYAGYIDGVIREADVVLAVIGKLWLGRRPDGGLRIQDEDDPIRIEVSTALGYGRPIIPVFIDGMSMPGRTDLPAALQDLAVRNGMDLSPGRDFDAQVERLTSEIERLSGAGAPDEPEATSRPATGGSGLAALGGGCAGLLVAMVTSHYLLVMKLDANALVFRLAGIVLPALFGFLLGRRSDVGYPALLAGAAGCAIVAAGAILTVVGLVDGTQIVPRSLVEWQESAELAGSIVLASAAGFWASRFTRRAGLLR